MKIKFIAILITTMFLEAGKTGAIFGGFMGGFLASNLINAAYQQRNPVIIEKETPVIIQNSDRPRYREDRLERLEQRLYEREQALLEREERLAQRLEAQSTFTL